MKYKFKCKMCKKGFNKNKSHNSVNIFCSNECKFDFRKDKILSKEINNKISTSKLGHSVSQEAKEKISKAFKGKTYEKIMGEKKAELRKKLQSQNSSKEKNFFWLNKGKLEYDWRKFNLKFKNKIRERDNQICMNCGKHREQMNKALDIHHIDYNEKNTIPQNCISLCRNCHGLTALNREYWRGLFQEKLSTFYGYKYSDKHEVILEYV